MATLCGLVVVVACRSTWLARKTPQLSGHPSSLYEHRPRLHVSRGPRCRIDPGLSLVGGRPYSSCLHEIYQQVNPRDPGKFLVSPTSDNWKPPQQKVCVPLSELMDHAGRRNRGGRPSEWPVTTDLNCLLAGIRAEVAGASLAPPPSHGTPPLYAGAGFPHVPGPCSTAKVPKTLPVDGSRNGLPDGPLQHSWSRPMPPRGPRSRPNFGVKGHG